MSGMLFVLSCDIELLGGRGLKGVALDIVG